MDGLEFHEFDAGVVGIVEVELPFAVPADFGLFVELETVFQKLFSGGSNVGHTESDVIHDAESVFVGVGGDVENVFEPVGAVGNLHVDPVGFVVLHAAVPVDAEAEKVFVEVIFGGAVVDDEACMDEVSADLLRRGRELTV